MDSITKYEKKHHSMQHRWNSLNAPYRDNDAYLACHPYHPDWEMRANEAAILLGEAVGEELHTRLIDAIEASFNETGVEPSPQQYCCGFRQALAAVEKLPPGEAPTITLLVNAFFNRKLGD